MFYSEDARRERLIFKDWGPKTFEGVPFHLVDPQGDRVPNVILLYGPQGKLPPKMPKSVSAAVQRAGQGDPLPLRRQRLGLSATARRARSTLIVRLHYADGKTEDHAAQERRALRRLHPPRRRAGLEVRLRPARPADCATWRCCRSAPDVIERIELVKGPDATAPVVMAVTVETR